MKSFIIFVIGVVVGVWLCYKYGYDYLTDQLANNMTMIVDQVMTNGIGTGAQNLTHQYEWQAQALLETQKSQLKETIKQQLTQYITTKIDATFK